MEIENPILIYFLVLLYYFCWFLFDVHREREIVTAYETKTHATRKSDDERTLRNYPGYSY